MEILAWILLALLILLGVPFLFQIRCQIHGSEVDLQLKFLAWRLWSYQYSKSSAAAPAPAPSTASKSPAPAPSAEPAPSTESAPASSAEPAPSTTSAPAPAPSATPATPTTPVTPELPTKPSPVLTSEAPQEVLIPGPPSWKYRLLRSLVEMDFILALSQWARANTWGFIRIFRPRALRIHFEMKTIDPLLLAKASSFFLVLQGMLTQRETLRFHILFGPPEYYFRFQYWHSFNLGQILFLSLRSCWGFPVKILWKNWRQSSQGAIGEWEEQLVQIIWKVMDEE